MRKLTTGQMIDQLGLDDTATNQDGFRVGYDRKGNLLMWSKSEDKPESKEGNEFAVYFPWIRDDEWEINYHFVDFETAQQAHTKERKTIIYHHNDEKQYRFVYGEHGQAQFSHLANDGISLGEIMSGKWVIEQ